MADRTEAELLQAVQAGDQSAFEQLYDRYHQQVQLMAWRVCHRADWVDDVLNEAWCRAFRQRRSFDPARSFPVWLAGILQNVYREHCRKSPLTLHTPEQGDEREAAAEESPENLAAEAEWLSALNDCVGRLGEEDAKVVRLRFFEDMPLRAVAQQLGIPESTLRDRRLPAAFEALRRCLAKKKDRHFSFFPCAKRLLKSIEGEEQVMDSRTNTIETALETLGKAHRDGAFSAAPGRYPWQAVESEPRRLARRPLAWVRVGAPLAAAAAVVVLFVIPSLLEKQAVERLASNVPSVVTPDEQPEAVAEETQLAMTTPTGEVNCDFNGDGQIDGRDIQAYLDRVRDTGGVTSEEDLESLRQCLLQ